MVTYCWDCLQSSAAPASKPIHVLCFPLKFGTGVEGTSLPIVSLFLLMHSNDAIISKEFAIFKQGAQDSKENEATQGWRTPNAKLFPYLFHT